MGPWHESYISAITPLTDTTRLFELTVPAVGQFDYQGGQFITIDLPIGEKRLERWRSYSIADAPDGSNRLNLCIVKMEGGRGSVWLFEGAEVGTLLKFKGPTGVFVLPALVEQPLVLICTGTGVAPFRAMLRQRLAAGNFPSKVYLIFGTRTSADVLFREEFESLQQQYNGFRYQVALSREDNGKDFYGYVHPLYEKIVAELPHALYYMCGWQAMIDEATTRLTDLGVPKAQIRVELYG